MQQWKMAKYLQHSMPKDILFFILKIQWEKIKKIRKVGHENLMEQVEKMKI